MNSGDLVSVHTDSPYYYTGMTQTGGYCDENEILLFLETSKDFCGAFCSVLRKGIVVEIMTTLLVKL